MAAKEVIKPVSEKKDPWSIMEEITLPRGDPKGSKVQFVRIGERTFSVPKGKPTKVPRPVRQLLARSIKYNDMTYRFIQENSNTTEL